MLHFLVSSVDLVALVVQHRLSLMSWKSGEGIDEVELAVVLAAARLGSAMTLHRRHVKDIGFWS